MCCRGARFWKWWTGRRAAEGHVTGQSTADDKDSFRFLADLEVLHRQTRLGSLLEAALMLAQGGSLTFVDFDQYYLMQQKQFSLQISLDGVGAGMVILKFGVRVASYVIRIGDKEWKPFIALFQWCAGHALADVTVEGA